ncbi:MAG: nucleotide exchange factor GrpE [Treponema sp.]|nr:MAG: nucleotide exchange factor GrpE [Treponema sp.]
MAKNKVDEETQESVEKETVLDSEKKSVPETEAVFETEVVSENGDVVEAEKPEECDKEPDLTEQISCLNEKCKELEGAYLRKAADFENYRKRMIKEKQEAVTYANSKLLGDLLVILDNFDRAVSTGIKDTDEKGDSKFAAFEDGVKMIKTQLEAMLQNDYGLVYYPAKGEVFDPNIHEAVAMNPSPDVKVATVGEELQKGYKLKDKVLRSSKVMVLMPAEAKKTDTEEEKNTEKEC